MEIRVNQFDFRFLVVWRTWLARRADNANVTSSSLVGARVTFCFKFVFSDWDDDVTPIPNFKMPPLKLRVGGFHKNRVYTRVYTR